MLFGIINCKFATEMHRYNMIKIINMVEIVIMVTMVMMVEMVIMDVVVIMVLVVIMVETGEIIIGTTDGIV